MEKIKEDNGVVLLKANPIDHNKKLNESDQFILNSNGTRTKRSSFIPIIYPEFSDVITNELKDRLSSTVKDSPSLSVLNTKKMEEGASNRAFNNTDDEFTDLNVIVVSTSFDAKNNDAQLDCKAGVGGSAESTLNREESAKKTLRGPLKMMTSLFHQKSMDDSETSGTVASTSSSSAASSSSASAASNTSLFKRSDKYSFERASHSIPDQVTLSWSNLTIKAKKRKPVLDAVRSVVKLKPKSTTETILDNVKGIVQPGEMLALMGSSGSGKTCLLNALNYSVKSPLKVSGKIFINGAEADSTRMKIVSSYIQQDDLFFGTLTVKEHLVFHAMLRMDKNISKEAKLKRVNQVLREFNLEKRANIKIGIPGRIKGISGGEKRRLAFASEILTDPPLMYLDEPTSGLDAFMAKSIIYYLQKMAQSGKTIVCTIHQPSSETFSIFDKICILSQTRVAYFGSRENALQFFTKDLNKTYPPFTNPADFYMDVLGVDVNDSDNSKLEIQQHCDTFVNSSHHQDLVSQIENVRPQYFNVPSDYSHYKASWCDQLYYLMQRCFFNYFRNHKVVINDLAMVIVTALLGGSIFLKTSDIRDGKCTFNQQGIENISFALYYTITVCVIFSTLAAVMAFPLEIPIYYREHFSSVYRSDTYYLSKLLNELPLYIILPTLHALTIYYMIGFGCDPKNFAAFLLIIILVSNAAYSIGHILSIVSSDVSIAVGLSAPVIAVQMLFSGFFLRKAMHTPQWLSYLKYISMFNYGYDLLIINQWEEVKEVKCEFDLEVLCLQNGSAIIEHHQVKIESKWFYMSMLLSLAVSFRVIAFIILWCKGRKDPLRLCCRASKFKNRVSFKT